MKTKLKKGDKVIVVMTDTAKFGRVIETNTTGYVNKGISIQMEDDSKHTTNFEDTIYKDTKRNRDVVSVLESAKKNYGRQLEVIKEMME